MESPRTKDRYWLHIVLFLLTLGSTVHMGGQLAGRWLVYADRGLGAFLSDGLLFGGSLLLFLTVHEFGHYFAARYHNVRTSLPYYIPLPFVGIGTLGAVIRIREPIPSTRKLFDIGAAGPLAGFVVALAILLYALATLPPPSYIFGMGPGHEEVQQFVERFGRFPDEMLGASDDALTLVVGDTLLYWLLKQVFADVPPMWEMYHYPVLFAGWLALFFTALNLMPVGQLDGGHVVYALFGHKWHARLARIFFLVLLISGSIGFMVDFAPTLEEVNPILRDASWFFLAAILFFFLNRLLDGELRYVAPVLIGIVLIVAVADSFAPGLQSLGYSGWLIWCLLLLYLVRVDHPPVLYQEPLTPRRQWLGYLCIVVFVLCFSLKPLYVVA